MMLRSVGWELCAYQSLSIIGYRILRTFGCCNSVITVYTFGKVDKAERWIKTTFFPDHFKMFVCNVFIALGNFHQKNHVQYHPLKQNIKEKNSIPSLNKSFLVMAESLQVLR
jgi:hypothetical protein